MVSNDRGGALIEYLTGADALEQPGRRILEVFRAMVVVVMSGRHRRSPLAP